MQFTCTRNLFFHESAHMRCAIMQPTYLPWAGYFNLISSVDTFVFLDDVQFSRNSWQSQNRIIVNGNVENLTLPIVKCSLSTLIKDVKVSPDTEWIDNHKIKILNAYQGADHFNELADLIHKIYQEIQDYSLSKINQILITYIANRLGINPNFVRASDLKCSGRRSEHLAEICRALSCDTYISPIGSKLYLQEDRFQENSGIKLHFQKYSPSIYTQYSTADFFSHMSILDVIANKGICYAGNYSKATNK